MERVPIILRCTFCLMLISCGYNETNIVNDSPNSLAEDENDDTGADGNTMQPDEDTEDTENGTGGEIDEPALTCDDVFGDAVDYIRCEEFETPARCAFNVTLSDDNCGNLCQDFGRNCLGALNNTSTSCTALEQELFPCDHGATDHICLCAK